ncbi:MAG: hypothetical protein AB7P33_08060 [Dehalococcoidia bacterium]
MGIAAMVAMSAFLFLVLACGGSSASGDSDGGGGGGGSGDGVLTVSPGQAKPGQVLTVRGSKLPKGSQDPVVRGDLVAETPTGEISLANINVFNQTFSQTAFVPDELTPGEYVIKLKLKGEHAGKEVSAKLTVIP